MLGIKLLEINSLQELFHQEMGKLIYYFNQCVETVEYDSKEKLVFYVLIKKIISNATSANILMYEGQINEAKIILRSAVETVILITYLSQFPDKINDYLDEAQIIKIKNNFIVFKNIKDGEPVDVYGNTCTREELSIENKRCFDEMSEYAKYKILNAVNADDFVITDKNFKSFDKFFTNFRPYFFRFEKMLKELDSIDFKIKDVFNYSLKDIIYCFYNESSQVAHSCFLDWHHKIKFNKKEIESLFHFFIKVTLFLQVVLKGTLSLKIAKTQPFVIEMQKAHLNLERIVYGHTLKH